MKRFLLPKQVILVALSSVLLLAACGGGGSDGGGDASSSSQIVDQSSSFTGVTTQAAASPTNAEDLAMSGFAGTSIARSLRIYAQTRGISSAKPTGNRSVFVMAQIIKQSVRRMDLRKNITQLRKNATQLRKSLRSQSFAASTSRTSTFQVQGDNGGTATFNLELNDATGGALGTVVYQGFTSSGLVIDGAANLLGTYDANSLEFTRLTLSFTSLTISVSGGAVKLTGSLSWGTNIALSSETLSMNMVLQELTNKKTYWFKNYEVNTVYSSNSVTQTISGRYYDHDYGYVDLTTLTPLVATYGNAMPSQGSLAFSGKSGRWIHLNFLETTLVIEADTDGDGVADWQVERPTNVTAPVNQTPTAHAGSDQSVNQWATVHVDGRASNDVEGDPLSYYWTIVSGPGGYTALTGANTATPSFTAALAGTYVLSLTVNDGNSNSQPDTVTVVVTPTTPSNPAFVAQQWQFGIYGSYIGQTGLFVTDLDGDGTSEIIAGASTGGFDRNAMWYVLRQTADGKFAQVWCSPIYTAHIIRILLADMNGDGKDDVVVALEDGSIRIYDGPSLTEIKRMQLAPSLKDIAIADLDGDSTKKIIASDGTGVFVYNAQTGALKWSVATGGGNSIAVGNVDADPALEIVTTTYGDKGRVLNGLTGAVKWEYVNGFGAQVKLADLDGDGMQEIIGASPWYKITIFDADLKSPSWEIATDLDINAVAITDTDGDGIPEILYGDGQWGKVHAIDVRTRTERWSVNNPEHGVSGIAFADVDKDGKKELLWGAGGTSTGADFLYIADPQTGTIKWQNQDFVGLSALTLGDVDDDGIDDLVMVTSSSNSGYDGGIVHVFNAKTHALKYQVDLGFYDWMGSNRAVRVGDVDGDGHSEIVLSSSYLYDGFIAVYDGKTGTLKTKSAAYNFSFFSTIALADVDNDGKVEIVSGGGNYVVVFDGTTLQEKWRSVDLGGSVYDIKIADLDKDGHPDIIATTTNGRLMVFDGVTHTLKLMLATPARAIEIADIDGDGFPEILVGRNDGYIDVYDGVTFAIKKTVCTYGTTPIDALRVADVDGDGTSEWLVASNGMLSILNATGGLKWLSTFLGNNLGKNNSIGVKDVNGNGRKDIFIGTDPVLYQFE